MEIRKFFQNMWSTKDYEMNFFIKYCSLNAIVEYLNDGYELNQEQNEKLKQVISVNHRYPTDIEKLVQSNIPEKFIHYVIIENLKSAIIGNDKEDQLKNAPLTKEWLLKQGNNKIASNFAKNWMESFQYLVEHKTSSEDTRKKIEQIKEFKNQMIYLPIQDKNQLLDFINNKAMKYSGFYLNKTQYNIKPELETISQMLQQSHIKKIQEETSMSKLIKILSEQNEQLVTQQLSKINELYEQLVQGFNEMDTNKKTNILNLYNKHLLSGINQYLRIKPETRRVEINKKIAESLIVENIQCVGEVFELNLKQLQEEKLMKLSAKTEYFSQIKKQW